MVVCFPLPKGSFSALAMIAMSGCATHVASGSLAPSPDRSVEVGTVASRQSPSGAWLDSAPVRSLFNGRDLSGWDVYLGPAFSETDNKFSGPIPGLNPEQQQVFRVVEREGQAAIEVSGEHFGGLSTVDSFGSYHLRLEFQWGETRYAPRLTAKQDSGLLYRAVGPHAADWFFWMRSLELQIQEGDCGDFWGLANAVVDIAARNASEPDAQTGGGDDQPFVFDPTGKPLTFSRDSPHGRHVQRGTAGAEKPNGQWNTIDLFVLNDTSVHVVNSVVQMVVHNPRQPQGEQLEPWTTGKIQLQSEGAQVFYRNIQIQPIDALPEQLLPG